MKAIYAESLLKNLCCNLDGEPINGNKKIKVSQIRKAIEAEQEVETAPVRHGKWIHVASDKHGYKFYCSECGRVVCTYHLPDYPYCNCGAKMEVGENE